jgi:ABC-type nitrate/sulfonate/bicarbonate transport system substrate-binding protein
MMTALQPMLSKLAEMMAEVEKNPEKAIEMVAKIKESEDEFKPLEDLMNQFEEIAKSTENGKIVMDDEEFGNEMKKQFGLPDDM